MGRIIRAIPRPAGAFTLFVLAFLASRIPLLGIGYGSDPDAWRNIVAALHVRAAGHYIPSRVPGFPVFELLLAALAPWGWRATNLAAALAQLGALVAFARVLDLRGARDRRAALVALAFGAALWVHATQTMDYAFGLAFFLAAYAALLEQRAAWAGAWLALACGCRPSYALVLPAAVAFLALGAGARTRVRGSLARFLLGFAPLVLALFVPVMIAPEARDLGGHLARHASHHVTPIQLVPVLRGSVVFLIGKWAATLLIGFAIAALVRRIRGARPQAAGGEAIGPVPKTGPAPVDPAGPRDRAATAFEALAALALVGFFLLTPYEQAYLLPVLPLLLILLARRLPPRAMAAFACAMALQSLVSLEFAERRAIPGDLFLERAQRRADLAGSRALLATPVRAPTVIEVGRFGVHRLLALDRELIVTDAGWSPFSAAGVALIARDRPLAFAERLTEAQADSLRRAGWSIRNAAP